MSITINFDEKDIEDFLYILYSYTFENGIAFNTYNIAQAEIQEHLEENYYV